MKRRDFIKKSSLATVAAATGISHSAAANETDGASPERPNIVFFFSDQQRWDSVGCYGQELPVTPNLDAMAAEGTRFENAFTCQPVCGPARSCLQTGRYATETGCFRNGIALPEEEPTIAKALSAGGYEVGYLGKWHLASTHGMGAPHDVNYRTLPVPPTMLIMITIRMMFQPRSEFTNENTPRKMPARPPATPARNQINTDTLTGSMPLTWARS